MSLHGDYPPRRKKIFRDSKSKYYNDISTCCTEDVQNMYRKCRIYLEYYYSERECKGAGTCPCMEINVSVQYNGGLLPDIILSTRCVFFKK